MNLPRPAVLIEDFVDEHLSNWYVRFAGAVSGKENMNRIRSVLTRPCMNAWKQLSGLMAPISPFFSDAVFQNLNALPDGIKAESVHHADFPVANEAVIDESLEERMQLAQDVSSLILSLTQKSEYQSPPAFAKSIDPCVKSMR